MNWDANKAVAAKYFARWGGMGEFAIAELQFEDAFWELVQKALDRNQPLTYEEVRAAFPDAAWEE